MTTSKGKSKEAAPAAGQKKQKGRIGVVDIARESGLSTGLVSSFLSGRYHSVDRSAVVGISEASTVKIRKACQKIGYEPENPLWRARIYPEKADLTFLLSKTVGSGFVNDYFGRMMWALAGAAEEADIRTGFSLFDPDLDYSLARQSLPTGTTEGLANKFVVAGRSNPTLVARLMEMGGALVFLSRASGIPGTVSVVPDYRAAATQALQMLYALGHRKVAVAAGWYFRENSYNARELRAGALAAANDLGIALQEEDFFIAEDNSVYDQPDLLARIRAHSKGYSAIFCLDDSIAHALYQQTEMLGLTIPENISLVGCNDESVASILRPGLSTVHYPVRRMGRLALEEAMRMVEEGLPASDKVIVLPTAPVMRQSIKSLESGTAFAEV